MRLPLPHHEVRDAARFVAAEELRAGVQHQQARVLAQQIDEVRAWKVGFFGRLDAERDNRAALGHGERGRSENQYPSLMLAGAASECGGTSVSMRL